MATTNPNRVQAGVPTGGQFATGQKADTADLAAPVAHSASYDGAWRKMEWNDAEHQCPKCGRDIGDDYHDWDAEDGTHNICQSVGDHLTDDGFYIREDDFEDLFGVQCAPSGDLLEFEDVQGHDQHHVWTITIDGGDNLYASPGFHIVNRLGYITTERPWSDDTPDAEWAVFDGDDEDEDED